VQVILACIWGLACLSENGNVPISGVQQKGFDCTLTYWVGVAKLSVEQGFLLLQVYNWGWITVCYSSGVSAIQDF